jgi:hypothetical protein
MLGFAFHIGATAIAGQLVLGSARPTLAFFFGDFGFGTLAIALVGGVTASFLMLESMNRRERRREQLTANFSEHCPPSTILNDSENPHPTPKSD